MGRYQHWGSPNTIQSLSQSLVPNGRLFVPPGYYQTASGTGDQPVQLNAANDWAAQKIIMETDWELVSLAWFLTAVPVPGIARLAIYSDDGAVDSAPLAQLAALNNSYNTGSSADVWLQSEQYIADYQLQRNVPYWIVFKGTDGDDFSLSGRRWNTNLSSIFPDGAPAAKISTDGGSSWVVLTQDSKPAILNLVLNASANIVAPLIYGRYNGKYVYLPGVGMREIPEEGVSLAMDTGFTPGTVYNVYIYDNAGTLTLEAVTTAAVPSDGILVKAGATTHRYLGQVCPKTLYDTYEGPVDCMDSRLVMNHYNKVPKPLGKLCPYSASTTDNGVADTWERWNADSDDFKCEFLSDAISSGYLEAILTASSQGVTGYVLSGIALDSNTVIAPNSVIGYIRFDAATSCYSVMKARALFNNLAPGYHYSVPLQTANAASTELMNYNLGALLPLASTQGILFC